MMDSEVDVPERLMTYTASLLVDWFTERSGHAYVIEHAIDGETPVFVARSDTGTLAVAMAPLWEAGSDPAAEDARLAMQERLDAGSVRGPYLVWVPPRGAVPGEEPAASDFAMRVQLASAPMQPGGRAEIDLPVQVQLAKVREEGGYASVVGGLSRFWTSITERVNGTFHVNSLQLRRAPQAEPVRTALLDRIGELSRGLNVGDAVEFDCAEAWTVQRLRTEPLGEHGFAIAQAPPKIDPSDGTLMRRMVRKRLKAAGETLAAVPADVKGAGLLAIYEYAEHENVGSFVKSLDPGLFAGLGIVAAVVDGEVRPVFQPR